VSFIGTLQPSEVFVKQSAEKQTIIAELITYPEHRRSPMVFIGFFVVVFFVVAFLPLYCAFLLRFTASDYSNCFVLWNVCTFSKHRKNTCIIMDTAVR